MRYLLPLLLVIAFHAGTGAAAWAQQPMLLPVHPQPLVAETAAGDQSFSVEVADDADEHARGLMFRRSIDRKSVV